MMACQYNGVRRGAAGPVRVWAVALAAALAAACGDSTAPGACPESRRCEPWLTVFTPSFDVIFEADIPTYDGSGQTVHPDVARVPEGLSSERLDHWLAVTPYPAGNAEFENPSVLASRNPRYWGVPRGLVNPLAVPRDVSIPAEVGEPPDFEDEAGERPETIDAGVHGHFSDPDLVWAGRLVVYFRYSTNADYIFRATSGDGVGWSRPELVLTGPFASILSPSVVHGAAWQMWAVDGRNGGCRAAATQVTRRKSSDGVLWSEPVPVSLTIPGHVPWHLDVQWIPEHAEYWALVAAYAEGATCGATDLFLATSADGLTWQVLPRAVLRRGEWRGFQNAVYRSTFVYDAAADAVIIWYSGYTGSEWRTAVERVRRSELVRRVGE